MPGFEAGLINGKHGGRPVGQSVVATHSREGKFDDIAGHGFVIISRNGLPREVLSDDDLAFWAELGGKIVHIGNGNGTLKDVDGYFTRLMDEMSCDVIVKRPDYYMFAACEHVDGLPILIADLRHRLHAA